LFCEWVCREAYSERVVFATQPPRCRLFDKHQISDCLCAIFLQLGLLSQRERFQKNCDLMVMRCDKDETLVLRALLELEDAMHSITIARITAQSVAGLSRVSDETAALEVRG
jgi:hypothetical protein